VTRVEIRLDEWTRVTRQDGLLDVIELRGRDVVVSLTVGPAGADAAAQAGAQFTAAAERQHIPETAKW
jgi:hypothetical protein